MKFPSDSLLLRPADVIDMPKRARMTMLNMCFMEREWRSQEQEIYREKTEINHNKIDHPKLTRLLDEIK